MNDDGRLRPTKGPSLTTGGPTYPVCTTIMYTLCLVSCTGYVSGIKIANPNLERFSPMTNAVQPRGLFLSHPPVLQKFQGAWVKPAPRVLQVFFLLSARVSPVQLPSLVIVNHD